MCPNKPTADELKLLQELDGLQAREPVPEIEPPAMIDQAVRNMARRELQHHRSPLAGKLRWLAGLSTASIALIALGISLVQTPTAPGPTDESFKSRKTELSSIREESPGLAPAAPAPSRSTAEAVMEQSADSAVSGDAAARLKEDKLVPEARLSKDGDLADAAYSNAVAAEALAAADTDSPLARQESAQAWLDLIQQLHEQGLQTDALEQLQAWQEKYPELPLPDWAVKLKQSQP